MQLRCCRCGETAEPMAAPPMPGEVGEEIRSRVCAACWQEWTRAQVILINEHRLSLIDPRTRAILAEEMRAFLGLGPAGGP